jgi:hypothetical protein
LFVWFLCNKNKCICNIRKTLQSFLIIFVNTNLIFRFAVHKEN